MLKQIDIIIKEKCKIDQHSPVILGVSGGPDSLCLLDTLYKLGYLVVVAHLDHAIRESSSIEAGYVKQLAYKRGYPFVLERMDVQTYAQSEHLSLEEAARIARYHFLFKQAKVNHAQAVLVAHNANDQVESVLMHLLRGSGLSGLKGMTYFQCPNAWSDDIPLVRPLLGTWRNEILDYIQKENMQPIHDESNLDTTYFRNRLRHELIPYLETFNPHIKQNIWQTADILQGINEIITDDTNKVWEKIVRYQGSGYVGLDYHHLLTQKVSVTRQLFRKAIKMVKPDIRDITYSIIEQAIEFLHTPSKSSQIDLFAGIILLLEKDILWFALEDVIIPSDEFPQLTQSKETLLEFNTTVSVSPHWILIIQETPISDALKPAIFDNPDPYQAWLDKSAIVPPLILRSRRPGDKIQPLGMDNATMKVSDFMINKKIPRRVRKNFPLIISGNKVAWIPGYTIGRSFQINNRTETLLHLKFQHKEETSKIKE